MWVIVFLHQCFHFLTAKIDTHVCWLRRPCKLLGAHNKQKNPTCLCMCTQVSICTQEGRQWKGKKFGLSFPSWQRLEFGNEADVCILLLLYTIFKNLLSDPVYYSDSFLEQTALFGSTGSQKEEEAVRCILSMRILA